MPTVDEVVREIEERKKVLGEEVYKKFHNFYEILPLGYKRRDDYMNLKCTDERASKKMQNITYAEFIQDVDLTIEEVGLDVEEIKRLRKGHNYKQLYEYTLSLYIRLREKGYNHYPDLTV